MSKISAIILSVSLFIMNMAYASTIKNFSPYTDFTLNVHWDSSYQDLEPSDLLAVSQASGVKNFHLAFITDAGGCQPAWGGQSSYATAAGWGTHLTDKLHANGIGYIVSLGGAAGEDLSKACTDDQLVAAYEQIIKTYQPEGLDFDIENGTANVAKVMSALKQVQAAHPDLKISLTLPVLPEGLVSAGKDIVKQAHDKQLRFTVNIMAMDYGPAYVNDMGEYAVQAATQLFAFLKELNPEKSDTDIWHMIEVTPMIGVNDVNVEQFTLKNADTLRNFANQNQLQGVSMWDINRDQPCADTSASLFCSGDNLQTASYDYARRFMQI